MKTYNVIVRASCSVVVEAPDPQTAEEIALKRVEKWKTPAIWIPDKAECECEYTEDGKVLAV